MDANKLGLTKAIMNKKRVLTAIVFATLLTGCQNSSTAPGYVLPPSPSPPSKQALEAEKRAAEAKAIAEAKREKAAKLEAARQAKLEAQRAKRVAAEEAQQERLAAKERERQAQEEAERQAELAQQQQADEDALARVKARIRKDHPGDYSTQKYVYGNQVEAYEYMKTVGDAEIKAMVERDHPDDYSTQKYVYDNQIEAKKEMGP